MNWILVIPTLAEFPAEMIVWILVGIAWAIFQIVVKMNKARSREPEDDKRRPGRELRPTADPVSPNDELRRFLREITGEGIEEEKPPPPPQRRQPEPAPLRPAPERLAPQRAAQTASIAESRRQAASAAPSRRPNVAPPSPPPPPPRSQIAASRPDLKKRPVTGAGAKTVSRRVTATPKAPRQRVKSAGAGLGNWRAAILHREIMGPPRALRPYSPSDF